MISEGKIVLKSNKLLGYIYIYIYIVLLTQLILLLINLIGSTPHLSGLKVRGVRKRNLELGLTVFSG